MIYYQISGIIYDSDQQIKAIYNTIESYQGLSGVSWDNERGANIEGEASTNVWNEYVAHKVSFVDFPERH